MKEDWLIIKFGCFIIIVCSFLFKSGKYNIDHLQLTQL